MKRILGLLGGIVVVTGLVSCDQGRSAAKDGLAAQGGFGDSTLIIDPRVIYGDDNRTDLFQISDPSLLALADSTVALMEGSKLQVQSSGRYTLAKANLGTDMNLCSSERFRDQPDSAFCSGSLVGPDLVLTAGHCIPDATACSTAKFVFGFAVKTQGVNPSTIEASEVYSCVEILHTQAIAAGADFAVVRLNRAVPNHKPLAVNSGAGLNNGDDIFVIGNPVGLPTKIAGGAQVRSNASPDFYVTNLDTYGGNSGSAVFNSRTGLIEGVLVRGEQDFISNGSCNISNVCAAGACRGEDVTRIAKVLPFIGAAPQPTPAPSKDVVFTNKTKLSVPDNNATGATSKLTATDAPNGRKVLVKVDIDHTYIGDLKIDLIAPNGATVNLRNRQGGSQQGLHGTFGGDLVAAGDLKILTTLNTTGEWRLRVTDLAARDVGALTQWSLIFRQ